MTHYTPLRDHRNGRVHLSPDVFRLDTHQPIYRRRRHTWDWWAADAIFRYLLPFLALLLFAALWVGVFFLVVVGIGRAIRFVGGF